MGITVAARYWRPPPKRSRHRATPQCAAFARVRHKMSFGAIVFLIVLSKIKGFEMNTLFPRRAVKAIVIELM